MEFAVDCYVGAGAGAGELVGGPRGYCLCWELYWGESFFLGEYCYVPAFWFSSGFIGCEYVAEGKAVNGEQGVVCVVLY